MLIDTNVIVRYLVETPDTINSKFKNVFSFFEKLETGVKNAEIVDLVLFQTFFVLTSYYEVPAKETAEKLSQIVSFKGIVMADKDIIQACLKTLQTRKTDPVDAYLAAYAKKKQIKEIYSFDKGLSKLGVKVVS